MELGTARTVRYRLRKRSRTWKRHKATRTVVSLHSLHGEKHAWAEQASVESSDATLTFRCSHLSIGNVIWPFVQYRKPNSTVANASSRLDHALSGPSTPGLIEVLLPLDVRTGFAIGIVGPDKVLGSLC